MSIPITTHQLNHCPRFQKDIKTLYKATKNRALHSSLENDEECSSREMIESVPYIEAIVNTILNKLPNGLTDIADKYGKQPFLQSGWTIWKMRYAIDNKGKSGGTRTIFCVSEAEILFVCIKSKKDCANEAEFQNEFLARIKEYLCL